MAAPLGKVGFWSTVLLAGELLEDAGHRVWTYAAAHLEPILAEQAESKNGKDPDVTITRVEVDE